MAGSITETLTESFCERCGSRYTFASSAPKKRLRGIRVATRGLKTFVLDDKQSFAEAMAAARSDSDRETSSSQLDAFHKTFNFCMQCRQYTCPNCWNEADGRCLTCAPLVAIGAAAIEAPAAPWEIAGLNGNGHVHTAPDAAFAEAIAATNGDATDEVDAFDPLARLASLTGPFADPIVESVDVEPQPAETVAAEAESVPTVEQVDQVGSGLPGDRLEGSVEAASETDPLAAEVEPEAMAAEPEAAEPEAIAAEPGSAAAEPGAVAAEPGSAAAEPEAVAEPASGVPNEAAAAARDAVAERAATAAERTSRLLAGLRPGSGLGAYDRVEPAQTPAPAVEPEPESVAVAEPEAAAGTVVPEPIPTAPEPEPEPVAARPEPAPVDLVSQPTWPVVERPVFPPAPVFQPPVIQPPAVVPPPAAVAPEWPATPQWPAQQPGVGLPFLGRPAVPSGGVDALWAESDRAVSAQPGGRVIAGVQPCVSCGLSLSASARFCRRCGNAQR